MSAWQLHLMESHYRVVTFHFSLHMLIVFLFMEVLCKLVFSEAAKKVWSNFNKCLRRIWNLPANTHAGILHCCTGFNSNIFNTVFARASKFLDRAAASSNFLVRAVFFNPPAFIVLVLCTYMQLSLNSLSLHLTASLLMCCSSYSFSSMKAQAIFI